MALDSEDHAFGGQPDDALLESPDNRRLHLLFANFTVKWPNKNREASPSKYSNGAQHGVIPMFTVAAFLPFLPLIEDAMIRQLGDDDFAKREAATRFLAKVLQDTDGCRNYSLLLAVKKARVDKNPEISMRAKRLYLENSSNYYREYLYLYITLNPLDIPDMANKGLTKESRQAVRNFTRGYEVKNWGGRNEGPTCVICVTPKDFNSDKLNQLKAKKGVVDVLPTNVAHGGTPPVAIKRRK